MNDDDITPIVDEDGNLLDPGPDDNTQTPESTTDHVGCLAAVALIGLLMLEAFKR